MNPRTSASVARLNLPRSGRTRLFLAFAVLLVGARLAVVGMCAPLVPFWDEWTATAAFILKPWNEFHHVAWSALWAPHNDHRIVLTRLWEIAWFTLLGEWDPTVVATANACVLTAAQAGFVGWVARSWTSCARAGWFSVAAALLVVPFGYANLLVSFQSQFHFLAALGLLAVVAVTRVETTRWGLPVTLGAAALALFSTGAGLLVAVIVGCVAAVQSVARRRVTARTSIVWAGAVLIFAVGWSVRPPPTFNPATSAQIAVASARYASWPASNLANLVAGWPESARYLPARIGRWPSAEKPAIAVVAAAIQRHPFAITTGFGALMLISFLPSIVLFVRLLRAGDPSEQPAAWALVTLAGWSALNALGMAAARSGDLLVPPRYQDLLVLGLLANAGALFALRQFSSPSTRALRPLIWLWTVPTGVAVAFTAVGVVGVQLPRKASESAGARETVQSYVASGNPELFRNRPTNFVPSPGNEEALAQALLEPGMRAILPVELRSPVVAPSLPGRIVRVVLRASGGVAVLAAIFFAVLVFRNRNSAPLPSPAFSS
ncbi:MAG: hypothetical protein ABIO94_08250 [Opitutaceae bacterium]